jgi:hypothetical protein
MQNETSVPLSLLLVTDSSDPYSHKTDPEPDILLNPDTNLDPGCC